MSLSSWVKEQIETRSRHHRLVWVHDPCELLETDDVAALCGSLQPSGHELLPVRHQPAVGGPGVGLPPFGQR